MLDVASPEGELSPPEFIAHHFAKNLDRYENGQIAQAVLSHPHFDHISGCDRLKLGEPLYPALLTCPHDKFVDGTPDERIDWKRIRDPSGANDAIIETYQSL